MNRVSEDDLFNAFRLAYYGSNKSLAPDLESFRRACTAILPMLTAKVGVPDPRIARYDWMVNEPQGTRHLLDLLREGKGSIESFGTMIDRIKASKEAAMLAAAPQHEVTK